MGKQTNKYRQKWPFAVIGSMDEFRIGGQTIRGRQYPWGVVNILDESHSDFSILRSLLVGYMLELVDITHDLHYEKYREQRMFYQETSYMVTHNTLMPLIIIQWVMATCQVQVWHLQN